MTHSVLCIKKHVVFLAFTAIFCWNTTNYHSTNVKKLILKCFFSVQSNRVTMKLDVSYTDHSHIIGRGGLSIKGVMEETGCHIHFPDSNRNNPNEKSNQVSIAGEIDGVERARARVRVNNKSHKCCW